MKSISSPTLKRTNISSPTTICSKHKITSTLSTSIAMGAPLKASSENNTPSKRGKHSSSSNNSLKPSKSSTSTTSCIEISNPITSSSTVESSKLEILASVRAYKKPKWPKPCWGLPYTWLPKSSTDKSTLTKQISGPLELCSIKCSMGTVPSNPTPFLNLSKYSRKQN